MTRLPRPPRLARALVARLLRGEMREVVLGDLDEEFARAIERGGPPSRARRRYWRQALASLVARERPAVTGSSSARPLAGILPDIRYAARVLAKAPGFAAVAAISLGIGIGANTTVYHVIRAVLVEPLPVERPQELKLAYWIGPARSKVVTNQINSSTWQDPDSDRYYNSNLTYPMFEAMAAATPPAVEIFAFTFLRQVNVAVDQAPPLIAGGLLVSGRYFSATRLELALGRPLGDADDRIGAPPVVVVSHGFWSRALGADPRAIGRVIRVNGVPCEVIGVTRAGYRGLSQGGFFPATDVTLPIASQPVVMPEWTRRPVAGGSMFTSNLFWVRVIARVPAEAPAAEESLTASLRQVYAGLPGADPQQLGDVKVRLLPGARGLDSLQMDVEAPLRLLAGVSGIVLLMACLNLAGLQLARGVSRQRELAVRRALGATRARIIRVLLAESALLAAIGGTLGVLLAVWAGPLVTSMLATGLGAGGVTLGLDWPLVLIALSISAASALLAGLVPAIRLSGRRASELAQRGAAGSTRFATGRVLIALQIAVSVPLLVGAGLLLRTVSNLGSAQLGFNPDGLVVFRVDPALKGVALSPDPIPMYERILERVRALPDVASAALVENVLVSGRTSNTDVALDGVKIRMTMNAVGPEFFETMRVAIVLGRGIGPQDRAGAPPVVVINEAAADRYFKGASPLGRRLTIGKADVEIVGVAATTLYRNLRTPPEPMFFDSVAQRSFDYFPSLAKILRSPTPSPIHVVVRSARPASLMTALPAAIREVEPQLPLVDIKTQTDQIAETTARERMFTRLLVIFGGFAVVLACIGLHGVTAYAVARRTSEIGIRVALGAQRGQVLWLILKQVVFVAIAGLLIGVPVAIAAGPVVGSLLFGLAPRDAVTILAAATVMLLVAVGAGWLPARRAARVDPVVALRSD